MAHNQNNSDSVNYSTNGQISFAAEPSEKKESHMSNSSVTSDNQVTFAVETSDMKGTQMTNSSNANRSNDSQSTAIEPSEKKESPMTNSIVTSDNQVAFAVELSDTKGTQMTSSSQDITNQPSSTVNHSDKSGTQGDKIHKTEITKDDIYYYVPEGDTQNYGEMAKQFKPISGRVFNSPYVFHFCLSRTTTYYYEEVDKSLCSQLLCSDGHRVVMVSCNYLNVESFFETHNDIVGYGNAHKGGLHHYIGNCVLRELLHDHVVHLFWQSLLDHLALDCIETTRYLNDRFYRWPYWHEKVYEIRRILGLLDNPDCYLPSAIITLHDQFYFQEKDPFYEKVRDEENQKRKEAYDQRSEELIE